MRALRVSRGEVFLDRAAPEPTPGPGEALIRPTLVGIGPADLAVVRGETRHEGVLGHQFVGVVEDAADPADRKAWAGRRVVADINVADRQSEAARRGLSIHDPARRVLGLRGLDGCLAERFVLPVRQLAGVPEGVPDEAAVFAEPLAAAVHASRIVRLEGRGFVTVLGDNLSALLCAQVMARLNHTVRILGERADRLAIAERWGVKQRQSREVGLRNDQDVVIECTGEAESVEFALGLVAPRGHVVLKTEPMPLPGAARREGPGPDLTPAILHEISLIGCRCGRVADAVAELAHEEASRRVDTGGLLTRRFGLDDAVAALRVASDAAEIKVAVEIR